MTAPRVHLTGARRAGIPDAEFQAFNKRPMRSVTDDELTRYFVPGITYLGDRTDVGVCTTCSLCQAKETK